MKTPEGKLKDEVKKFLKERAGEIWFFMPVCMGYGVRGIPDFIGCCHGKFFAIETKAPTKKAAPWQDAVIKAIRMAGGAVIVSQDIEDIKRFITYHVIL